MLPYWSNKLLGGKDNARLYVSRTQHSAGHRKCVKEGNAGRFQGQGNVELGSRLEPTSHPSHHENPEDRKVKGTDIS